MLKDITIGQYYPGKSFVHRLDPRTKILLVILFVASLFIVTDYVSYLFIFLYVALTIYLSKLPFKLLVKGLKPLKWILIFTFIINMIFIPGEEIYSFWIINITDKGLDTAIRMSIRLIFLVIGASVLTLTTSPIELTDGIEDLLRPFNRIGLPSHEIAMMMTIALRFIPTLIEETDKIMKAQMARGADFESGNLMNRAKNLLPLLVPLFINSFRRADELANAMEARCYRGGDGRTKFKELKYTKRDRLAGIFTVVFFVALIIWRFI